MEQPQARVIRWYGLQTAYTTYWVKSTSEIGWFWNSKAGTLLTKRVPEWLGQYSVSCWLHCRKVSWRLLSMIFFDHILPILPYILIIYIYIIIIINIIIYIYYSKDAPILTCAVQKPPHSPTFGLNEGKSPGAHGDATHSQSCGLILVG
jgi:hypothetical protein